MDRGGLGLEVRERKRERGERNFGKGMVGTVKKKGKRERRREREMVEERGRREVVERGEREGRERRGMLGYMNRD